MQNPHESEATYRVKGKKSSVGYITNFVEARDQEKGLSKTSLTAQKAFKL